MEFRAEPLRCVEEHAMNIQSPPPSTSEPYTVLIAELWAAGTNSADIARILDLEEAAVERIRIAARDGQRLAGEVRS